jgi:putative hydrolase of HD superfamily
MTSPEDSRSRAHELRLPVNARQRVEFLEAAHRLTLVERLNRLLDGSRPESSAEHSWHLVLTAIVLADDLPPGLDLLRVVQMLAVHDIPEVLAGDVAIFDEQARIDIEADERAAAEALFGLLPAHLADRLSGLWQEFEAAVTPEARYARAIDRLQPVLVHWAGDGQAWASRKITVAQEQHITDMIASFQPELTAIAGALIDNAAARGMLAAERPEGLDDRGGSR